MATNGDFPRPGEIRKVVFGYEDDPTKSKARPAVVAVVKARSHSAIVVKVTGHGPRPEYPGEVRLQDWAVEGLIKPSTVRCSKLAEIEISVLAECEKYGDLSARDWKLVSEALKQTGRFE